MKAYERRREQLTNRYNLLYHELQSTMKSRQAHLHVVEEFIRVSSQLHKLDKMHVERMENTLLKRNIEMDDAKRRVTRKRRIKT